MPTYKQFPLADTAEGLTEADILAWRVQPGDRVTVNQIVVEVETAKAAVELPIPWAGEITELLVEPGQTVEVGTPILTIDVDPDGAPTASGPGDSSDQRGSGADDRPQADAVNGVPTADDAEMQPLVGYGAKEVQIRRRPRKSPPSTDTSASITPTPATVFESRSDDRVPLAKPPVRKLAKDLGIDLRALAGTGPGGVITREDVRAAASTYPTKDERTSVAGEREHRVPIKGVRKATATAMVSSAFTAPHVTEFLTVDVTPMMWFREKLRTREEFRNVKLTPLAFAARAVCLAVKRTPEVNAVWDEEAQEIVFKNYVDLGIAAATPRGLVVPKVREAQAKDLRELAEAINELTSTARDGKTPPADMLDGTFTITNVGVFGVDTGTPIINPGESAILALGTVREMPWVVDGAVTVRQVCQLALSFDHRVIDGQQGSRFLADVGAIFADPANAIAY